MVRRSPGAVAAHAPPPAFWTKWQQLEHLIYQIPFNDPVYRKFSCLYIGNDFASIPQSYVGITCNVATYLAHKMRESDLQGKRMSVKISHKSTDGSKTHHEVVGCGKTRIKYLMPSGSLFAVSIEE